MKRHTVLRAFEIKWSDGRPRGKAFTNRYHIPVEVITKDNAGDLARIFGFATVK